MVLPELRLPGAALRPGVVALAALLAFLAVYLADLAARATWWLVLDYTLP